MGNKKSSKDILKQRKVRKTAKPARAKKMVCHKPKFLVLSVKESDAKIENIAIRKVATNRLPIMFGGFNFNNNKFKILKNPAAAVALLLFVVLASFFVSPQYKAKPAPEVKAAAIKKTSEIITGNPVAWTALVRRSDINLNHYLLKLPKSASNIKITIVSAKQAENILSAKPKQELSLKQRQQIAIATSNSVGKQVKTPLSHKASEGQAKSFFARITTFLLAGLSDAVSRTTVTTTQAEDTGTALTTDSTLVDLSAQAPQPSPPPSPDATAEQSDFVKVDYETPAPVITEQATDTGKLVTVSAPTETPDQPQLTDVLASTKIPRLFKVGQESKIHIKWKNPSTSSGQAIAGEQEMVFKAYDTDKDGYLDYVEWTVPHLSTQIFDIIFISKAFQLDASQNITADIYDTVAHQDNVWANVPSGNYVRFTFESQLNNTKNIDIYAKPSAPSSDGAIAVAVEVYPVYTDADGNQTEGPLVAVFPTIDHADTYHANLANLSTNTDIFDFKIINASVDLDYVQDAGAVTLTINNSATTCTGGPDWTTSASCNVNITDIQNDLNAGTSVSFTATGDGSGAHIVVSNAFSKTAGGDATVSMYAGDSGSGNITVNAAISSTVGKLNMLFNADRGAVSSGYINIGAAITSNGGNITMGGGSGTISAGSGFAVGNSGQVRGVLINNVTVAAGGGNIIVNGQGYNTTTDGNNGVLVTGASGAFTTTGAGTINVTGNGAGNTSSGANSGVFMTSASVISTVSGALTVSGTGGGVNSAGYSNSGVTLTWGSSITSSGGVITITGNGGGGSNSDQNQGVHIGGGSSGVISNTGSGVINITANGGGGGGTNSGWDYGLYIGLGGVISTVNGNLTVSATGGGAGSRTNNYGVYVESTGTIKTTGSGNLSVTGIRGGGATASNYGVYLAVANSLQTTSTGAITVTADTIFLTEANDINSVGNLTIKPYTATSTVGIGAGAGTLALTDTYLGYLTWGASSILTIGSATAGNITINTASALLDSRVAFLTGGSYDVQAGTIGAVLGGTGVALTKSTAGTVTLSGANTFTGGVTLNSGQLNINNASALGTVAGTFTINGGTIDNTSAGSISTLNYPIALNGDFTWAGSTKSLYFGTGAITPNASRTITCNNAGVWLGFNGVIGGGAINLTKAGAGTLILYGASTYTGTTTVLAGTLIAGTNTLSGLAGAFGNATSDILLGNTTGSDSASLVILGAYTVGRNITVQSGSSGTAYIYSRNDSAIFSGNITLNKDVSLRSNNASYTTTFSGIISGGYNVNIVSNNPGTVTLSNANTYTGTTTISAGTLQVGNANALGTGSVAISGGTLVANNDFNVGGSWTYTSGGWTHNNHTVTFTSTALGNTITTGAQAFYGLTMNGTGGAWTLQDNLTATSTTLTQGTLIDNGKTVTVNGNISISSSAGSTLTSTGSWIQGASGNISNSNSNNAFKTLTIAGTGVTTTLTGNVRVGFAITGGGTITMGPGTINGGGLYSFFVAVHNNDDINVSNVAIGTSLYQFRIIPQVDVTQKVLTLPNNFGEVIFQNTYGHNITATGNFNFGNNTCGVIDKNDGTTPVNYVDMSASSLTCGALLMGYASALNDNGWLKLGSSTGHSFASINNGPGNAGTRNILDLGSGTTTISGSVNFTGINVTPGTSTVTLTGTGASNTLTSAGQSFYNLTQNGGSATDTYTLQDTLTVAHTLTLTKGVLDTKSGSNFGVTIGSANPVNGDFSQTTTAKFTARSSLITLNGNGNFTADGTLANSQYNSASLTLNGTNTLSYNNTDNTNGFNNLIVGQNGNTTTLTTGQQIPVGNLLTVGSGTLTQAGTELSGGVFLYGSNPLSFNVASVVSVPSLWFRSASQTIPSLTNGYDCSLTLSTDGTTVTQTGNVVLNTTKNLNLNNISGRAGTWKTDGYNLTTVGGDILIGNSGGNSALKKLDATHNGARTSTITVGGNWLNYGTGSAPSQFIADNSTVIFNSTATGKTITEGSTIIPNAFNNLTFNGTGGGWTLQDNLTASALTLTQGTLIDNGKTVTVNGNISISSSAGSTLTSTGSWIQGASGNISNSNSNNAFKTLTIAGTGVTTTLTGNVDVGNNIGSSLTIGPGTLYGGNWGLYFYPYSNDSLTVNNPIVGSSLDSFQFSNERSITQKAITLPNNFGSVYLRNDNGNLVATGNFNFGNNPLIFWATQTGTPTYYTDMGSYALTSGALTIGRTGSLDGFLKLGTSASHSIASIAVTSGAGTGNILDLGSSTTAVSGNVNLTGICLGSCITPTAGTSTITLSGGSGQTITSNSNPFNILTVTNSSAGGITFADRLQTATLNDTTDGSTLKFSAATAGARHTISSAMNITGGASKITLAPSVAATTWYLTAPTPTTATNVIVSYSNSSGHITPVTSTDGGNNLNWDFDTTPPTLATGVNPATLSYDNTASTVDIASAGTCADAGSGMNATQPYQVSYSDVGTSADTSCSSKSYTIGTAWGTSHATSFAGTDGHYYCVKLECKDAASTPNTSAFYSANNILYDITAPTISIGSSSASLTNTGPVTYTITYGGADAVTLANGNVTLNKTGTANGTAVVSGTGLTTRTVTISGITGDGTLGISIASGTASDNAGNTALAGGPSGTFSVDNTAPSAPTSLSWQETSPHNAVSVNSSWVKSSSGDLADQKIQFYSDDSCGATSGSLIDLSSSSLQTRAFTGTDGNTYTYKITSVDNAGNQTVSACSGAMMIDTSAPTGSGIFSISADSDSQLTVTADTPVDSKAGLDSAPYQFEETSGNHGADSSGWQTSSSYTDSGLSPNTEYIYKVRAKDSIGNTSGYSDTSSKYTLSAVPGLPSLTADTSAQITANWSANGNPTGTEFYIENMINSTNSGWITGTSWTSSNLACGTNYSFRVRARNADHTNSDYSATVDKTTNGCGGAGMIIGANNPPSSSPVISTNNGVVSAVTNIANQVATIVNKLSLPAGRQAPITETVPKETPESLNGLKIMSVNPLGKFAISPIQSDIAFFANKLPQLKKALDALAINANKAEDVKKLSQTQLYLPGLTQTILSPKEILQANKVANVSPTPKAGLSPAPQKELAKANLQANALAATKGIPLAQLSSASVAKMPSNLVFARTAGELVDFTSALSVDSKGNVQQKNNDYFRKANGAGD